MFLWVSGFLKDDAEDDTLKFDLIVKPEFEDAILKTLAWESLEAEASGEHPLTTAQVGAITDVIKEPLPVHLDLFIGVRE